MESASLDPTKVTHNPCPPYGRLKLTDITFNRLKPVPAVLVAAGSTATQNSPFLPSGGETFASTRCIYQKSRRRLTLPKLDGSCSDFTLKMMTWSNGWQTMEGEPAYGRRIAPTQEGMARLSGPGWPDNTWLATPVKGGHQSQYQPGSAYLNFVDVANAVINPPNYRRSPISS